MSSFGERLKYLRKVNNVQQYDLANTLGYGATAISNYENNNHEPSFDTLIKIAKYFDVTTDYLLGLSDHPVNHLKEDEKLLVTKYRRMDDKTKSALLNLI